ncbi:MAG: RNA 2',3'-cyclic phosphodiesterase [Candidatus Omnitrophica bacterium]|nr:RNA 2',3'-cyclic phosphodiesterase [Candidatus Omnitrophota bacterium]
MVLSRRLFIGIEPSAEARAVLAETAARLPEMPGVRLERAPTEDLHLTVRFIGEVPEARLAAVLEALRTAASATAPFSIGYGGIGVFPEDGPARVVWTGVDHGVAELRSLGAGLDERLRGAGFELERRVYKPHVTLARVTAGTGVDPYRALSHNTCGVDGVIQRVGHLILYESRAGAHPRYAALERAALKGAGP